MFLQHLFGALTYTPIHVNAYGKPVLNSIFTTTDIIIYHNKETYLYPRMPASNDPDIRRSSFAYIEPIPHCKNNSSDSQDIFPTFRIPSTHQHS